MSGTPACNLATALGVLTTFDHAQAVSCLAFTDDSNVLVSAAGDTTAHAWLLPDVLDAASAQNGGMTHLTPLHSW